VPSGASAWPFVNHMQQTAEDASTWFPSDQDMLELLSMTFPAGNGGLFQEDGAGVGSDVWQWGLRWVHLHPGD
jgi:hypothetical protein